MEQQADKFFSDFFIAMSKRICDLRQSGLIFDLRHFAFLAKNQAEITIMCRKESTFRLLFENGLFSLDNLEYKPSVCRPAFTLDDMVTYLLILTNKGAIPGHLVMPTRQKK